MDFSSQGGPYGFEQFEQLVMGSELGFVCQVLQQYLFMLAPDKRPVFVECISRTLNEALKSPLPSPPAPSPTNGLKGSSTFAARQAKFIFEEVDDITWPHEWMAECVTESPTDNIAFRTIPCRNWIKYKGKCRLGDKCKFIHDPDFISIDVKETEFPRSPEPHCWSYMQGTCYKGSQCKYYHPPAAHMKIYQRYTPCREWDACIRPACPFRHAPSATVTLQEPQLPSSPPFFEEKPPFYRTQGQSLKCDPAEFSTGRHGSGMAQAYPTQSFNPLSPLDPIREEFGSLPPTTSGVAAGRRKSIVGPIQPQPQPRFALFPGLDAPFDPDPEQTHLPSTLRPRGKSFDISWMLSAKREGENPLTRLV
ncbi:hypothetical protein EST38_g8947 [Candolleomyces aberdarensis]|uniref:C3H1-type domain-containing protein n=1 Tax=Candolleomyces aberdarensis TaxID=2316362 RepID=A0A4Q2DEI3_9AGAR|nr:hypothetical protein EST38_g8947 [Candolleomyces aberdarensis]